MILPSPLKTIEADQLVRCQAIIKILCDIRPPKPVDAAYLFAQTKDNEKSSFFVARELLNRSPSMKILILDSEPGSGYAGFDDWKGKLAKFGIEDNQIVRVNLGRRNHNTLTEAEAVVRFAKYNNYQAIVISAAPFHQVRAFMTTVRVATDEYPELKIYSIPGKALAWNESVIHSQGTLAAERSELINSEMERIDRYIRKGDLISFEEVAQYLERRDR